MEELDEDFLKEKVEEVGKFDLFYLQAEEKEGEEIDEFMMKATA